MAARLFPGACEQPPDVRRDGLGLIGSRKMRPIVAKIAGSLCGSIDIARQHSLDIGVMLPDPEPEGEGVQTAGKLCVGEDNFDHNSRFVQRRHDFVGGRRIDHMISALAQIGRKRIPYQHIAIGDYEAARS
jgi:hypothetical protein